MKLQNIMLLLSFTTSVAFATQREFDVSRINGFDKYDDWGSYYIIAKNDPKQKADPVLTLYTCNDSVVFTKALDVNKDGPIITSTSMSNNGLLLVTTLCYSPSGDDARKTICFNKAGKKLWETSYSYNGGEAEMSPNGKFVIIKAGINLDIYNAVTGTVDTALRVYNKTGYIATFDLNDNAIVVTNGLIKNYDVKKHKVLNQNDLVKVASLSGSAFHISSLSAEDAISASPMRTAFACVMADGATQYVISFNQDLTINSIDKNLNDINGVVCVSEDNLIISVGPLKDRAYSAFENIVFDTRTHKELFRAPSQYHKTSNAFEDVDGIHFLVLSTKYIQEAWTLDLKKKDLLKTSKIRHKLQLNKN